MCIYIYICICIILYNMGPAELDDRELGYIDLLCYFFCEPSDFVSSVSKKSNKLHFSFLKNQKVRSLKIFILIKAFLQINFAHLTAAREH